MAPDFDTEMFRATGSAATSSLEADPSGSQLEWLQTDGVGGFASSTLYERATRRYHGLLIALPAGHAKRHLFLSRFDETLRVGDREAVQLDMADYGDSTPGDASGWTTSFGSTSAGHKSRTIAGIADVRRTVAMTVGAPTVSVQYLFGVKDDPQGDEELELELRPLLPFREADALTFGNDVADLRPTGAERDQSVSFRLYEALPTLSISWSLDGASRRRGATVEFVEDPAWYRGIRFAADLARGYDGYEDQPSPGRVVVRGRGSVVVTLSATIGEPIANAAAEYERAKARRNQRHSKEPEARGGGEPFSVRRAVDGSGPDFLYRAPDSTRLGICAGYPWFGEWGRDTFIALPGLTLARGDVSTCREVLEGALPFLQNGLLPNIYGVEVEDSHYGSVDASLWYARAAEIYAANDGADPDFVLDALRPALCEIADAYRDGTDLGVGADAGMLIAAGGPELNATWMDARASDGPVTPRDGCAVEINALWIALLDTAAELTRAGGDAARALRYDAVREAAEASFLERLWLPDVGYLADRWLDGVADRKIRPNMVMAAALPRSPLSQKKRRSIVDVVEARLLTPRGLRTLAPSDPDYIGRYGGGCDERDRAYHQGTVWPWLLGFYTEARLRADGVRAAPALRALWDGFAAELGRAGLNHISEVFDGDAPHNPGGTIAQAWNSAELLRSYDLCDRWEAAGGDPDVAR